MLAGGTVAALPIRSWAACAVMPTETNGPFPSDGTNGPNILTQSGIVRSDIRPSFATSTTVAGGTPVTLRLQVVNASDNCAPLSGYAVYVWHCNAAGLYSMYSSPITGENYLRGVQVTDAAGSVTFTSVFPACYSGRWPHIHIEIYSSLALAVSGRNAVKITQIAMPEAVARTVFAQTALYPNSVANLNQVTLATDNVFGDDGGVLELATVSGSVSGGYTITHQLGISAAASSAAPDIDQQGLTGVWYQAASSGQGLALEVYPDLQGNGNGYLQGGWFTFDVAPSGGVDKQRWYTFGGAVTAGGSTGTVPLYLNTGGNFDTTPVTTAQQVGTVSLTFASCTTAQFAYAFSDGSNRSGTIPLTRLTPSVTCSTTAARPTNADFALSGNWYNAATSGQGFIVEVNPNAPVLYFAWYTYGIAGQSSGVSGQRWFTGQAAYTAGARQQTVTLYETAGGIFNTATLSTQTTSAVGTATLTFSNCSNATLAYAFTGGASSGLSGNIALSRVGSVPTGCIA
jgi:protocatechuate 3,4-dioxygenase beta subunit